MSSLLLMRDSITAADIPLAGLAAAAGYGDGPWAWSSEDWRRFDEADVPALSIVTRPGDVGDIADIERGDFAPGDAPGWVRGFNRPRRRRPSLYCARGNWPDVVQALRAAGLDPAGIDWWIATLDGTTDLFYGRPGMRPPANLHVVAIQVRGSAQTGGHYDESIILDPSWIGHAEDTDMTDPQAAQLQRVYDVLTTIPEKRTGGNAGDLVANLYLQLRDPAGRAVPGGDGTALSAVLAAVQDLQVPQVDAGAVAAALAADQAFLTAIGTTVADVLWERLRPGQQPQVTSSATIG